MTETPQPPEAAPEEPTIDRLRRDVGQLQATLKAMRSGGVDAVMVGEPGAEQLYILTSADRPYRVLVENMGEGAVTVSGAGVILYANLRLAEFLGVERNSMVGRDLLEYVDPDHHAALAGLLSSGNEETRRAELRLTRADGTALPFLVAATELDVEGVLVRCLIVTDLTMQKAAERQKALERTLAERQSVAQEVNDSIVQGLVAAEMALDLGDHERARALIARTSDAARRWIGVLAGDQELRPGMAVRRGGSATEETP